MAPFDRAHTTLYSSSIVTMPLSRFRDIAAYWSKIATPLVFGAPVGGEVPRFPQGPLVTKKTRMMGLSDGKKISMMRSAVSTQITHVTDGQTDGIGVAYTRYNKYAVARKNGE